MSIARAFTTRRVRQTFEAKDRDAANSSGSSSNIVSSVDNFLHRSKTTKPFSTHGSIRNKISGPVELTHTTNMLSYNAPNIFPGSEQTISIKAAAPTAATAGMMAAAAAPVMMTPSPSSSSVSSGVKSDDEVSDSGETNASTPPTSPDTPFPRDVDHKRAMSPEPNHLSCYFMAPKQAGQPLVNGLGINSGTAPTPAATEAATTNRSSSPSPFATAAAPAIPQRAPSHTKKSYDGLGRHRSVSRMSEQSSRSLSSKGSFSFSRSSSSSTSTSVASSVSHHQSLKPVISAPLAVSSSVPLASSVPSFSTHKKEYSESHPFGQELAKVSELVEEFKDETILEEESEEAPSTNPLYIEEERGLALQGLKKYSAESYISDIQSLMSSFFTVERPMAVWI
ncbi:hypothetical protein F503_02430 [Ophiostoma piceae UAMH 11346]|uniref:Uncharacterized protein n=1 Tax=Ophiostoma piceae (strain UAMH 11346) TaxID=1262450 RepID=S3C0N1_OPHP1|nr:hypothetical protein F503_02430 [Ophiostoma piceae UAMH 11346]